MTKMDVEDLAEMALNAAVRRIQDELGVTTGDAAGLFFSGDEVQASFRAYIHFELRNKEREKNVSVDNGDAPISA